jgi:hypothetical protein
MVEQQQTITRARRINQLMNRKNQCRPSLHEGAKKLDGLPRLSQIESVEWLIEKNERKRREKCECDVESLGLPFGKRTDAL